MKRKVRIKGLLKIGDQFKALVSRPKKVLPNLISPQQMAHVENRFIGESSRLIAGIIEITDILNKEGFLVAMDIEKPFYSLV